MRKPVVAVGVLTAAATVAAVAFPAADASGPKVTLPLTISSPQLASCLPGAKATVTVALTTDSVGFDTFTIQAWGLRGDTAYTVFLLEQAGTPFGAAEYIGDFFTDDDGAAKNSFRLIVAEAFSSTLVGATRVRKELNSVGFWFADPKDDDWCLGAGSPVTPFDGDNAAGVQVMNSGTKKLPAP